MLYKVTAYILIWGCVLIVIFLLLNFVIAVIFRAYAALHDSTQRVKLEFAETRQGLTARRSWPCL